MNISKKVALVTGAIALRLASNGADIAIVDVNDKKMEALSDHAEDGCV